MITDMLRLILPATTFTALLVDDTEMMSERSVLGGNSSDGQTTHGGGAKGKGFDLCY